MYCQRCRHPNMQNNFDENMINNVCKACNTNAEYCTLNSNSNMDMNIDMDITMSLNDDDSCTCGFDKEDSIFPENPVLGQSYVPIQKMEKTFVPCVGLKMGTLFPELVSPYKPCQSLEENAFIKDMNTIKEGCNKC